MKKYILQIEMCFENDEDAKGHAQCLGMSIDNYVSMSRGEGPIGSGRLSLKDAEQKEIYAEGESLVL